MEKRILICCNHVIPTGHPNATRLIGFGKIFIELGYKVTLFGISFENNEDFSGNYDGIYYISASISNKFNKPNKLFSRSEKLIGLKLEDYLNSIEKPDIIISVGYKGPFLNCILKYTKENNIKHVHSVVEWFDRNVFTGRRGLLKYVLNRYSLIILYPQIGNIITISMLLDKYYKSKGCTTIRIPTIVDINKYKNTRTANKDILRLSYAGSPAKKDYLANVIYGIVLLSSEERASVVFDIYGVNEEYLLNNLGISLGLLNTLKDTVKVHGKIPYEKVKDEISKSDFTVLLRPNKRYANAGFPTKVGESMAAGVPVIANLTSDLGMFIFDKKTGIICDDESPQAFAKALKRALRITLEQKNLMRDEAKSMAEMSFSYKNYINDMRDFLSNIK